MIKDLTVGKPEKVLLKYSLPVLGSVAFQQLYNIMDGVIAGHVLGDEALAAVGASFPIVMLFLAVAIGLNSGTTVLVSQKFGAKKLDETVTGAFTALISALVIGLAATLVGEIFSVPIMNLVDTPSNIFADGTLYLRYYMIGMFFSFAYNVCNGIFIALGDSVTPFFLLVFSSLANVGLDFVFTVPIKLGVSGLAIATTISQVVAAVIAFVLVVKKLAQVNKKKNKIKFFSYKLFVQFVKVSIPSILQQSCVSIGNMFIQNFVNSFGSVVIAGYASAIKLNMFALMIFNALSVSLAGFVAQNFGAKNFDRIKAGVRACFKLTWMIVIPFIAAYMIFGKYLMMIFVDPSSTDVIEVGRTFLLIVSPFYIVITTKVIFDSALRGAAAMKYFMISTFTDLVARIVFSGILMFSFASTGIWLGWPVGWGIGAVLAMIFYFKCDWKNNNVKL